LTARVAGRQALAARLGRRARPALPARRRGGRARARAARERRARAGGGGADRRAAGERDGAIRRSGSSGPKWRGPALRRGRAAARGGGAERAAVTDTRLAALARRAAADPGDLEAAVALRAAQERAGVAPPVRVLVARFAAGELPHLVTGLFLGRGIKAACGCSRSHTLGAEVLCDWPGIWSPIYEMLAGMCDDCGLGTEQGCVAAGLAGTPRDRVLLERQAAELARRVGVGAATGRAARRPIGLTR